MLKADGRLLELAVLIKDVTLLRKSSATQADSPTPPRSLRGLGLVIDWLSGWGMADPARVHRLTDHEGQRLQQIVRRGTGLAVRLRRAMVVLASAARTPFRLSPGCSWAMKSDPGCDPPIQRDGHGQPGPSVGGWPSPA